MSDLIDGFCQWADGDEFGEPGNFARAFCGPNCLFPRVVEEMLTSKIQPHSLRALHLRSALVALDQWIEKGNYPHQNLDATLCNRWRGLSFVAQALLLGRNSHEHLGFIGEAIKRFDAAWGEAAKRFKADWEPAACSDASVAQRTEEELFAFYESVLSPPWTPGSWMVWDILCQVNQIANPSRTHRSVKPLAVEKTNVLFGRGTGGLMKLVLELLPGPAQLVTPNWWRLGMAAISTVVGAERYFLGAIQRAMTLAAPRDRAVRLRWHLEATDERLWEAALEGRSGEAAAASVALAAYELLDEMEEGQDKNGLPEPILDENVAVSAAVGNNGPGGIANRPLLPVEKDTLPAKFSAAMKAGIDVVGLADGQPMDGVAIPDGLHVEFLPTVGEAFNRLRAVNRAFERYGDWVRSQFHYYEEETPPGP